MRQRRTDYQSRKDNVLGIVVNEYIKTVNPISSGYIAQEYTPDLSSATIRNILADLEEEGYLTHPHTSAGRIPTQQGYRYYVDHLMHEIRLLEDEQQRINAEYEQEVQDLEKVLERTSQVISDITHYTSIISIDGQKNKVFCRGTSFVVEYPEVQDMHKVREILRTLEQKEHLLEIINRRLANKIDIYIGHELACNTIENCSLAVSRYQFQNGPSGRIAVLGPTRMNYQRVVSALEYVSEYMREMFK
jgi:transcriptional regulator of heat shock response